MKWHDNSITCMVKHRPLMSKKVKKTFEILRSEITFLMDLYIFICYFYLHFNNLIVYVQFPYPLELWIC